MSGRDALAEIKDGGCGYISILRTLRVHHTPQFLSTNGESTSLRKFESCLSLSGQPSRLKATAPLRILGGPRKDAAPLESINLVSHGTGSPKSVSLGRVLRGHLEVLKRGLKESGRGESLLPSFLPRRRICSAVALKK